MRKREMTKKLKDLGYRLEVGTNRLGVEGYMVMNGGMGVLGNSQPFSATRRDIEDFIFWKESAGPLKKKDIV